MVIYKEDKVRIDKFQGKQGDRGKKKGTYIEQGGVELVDLFDTQFLQELMIHIRIYLSEGAANTMGSREYPLAW